MIETPSTWRKPAAKMKSHSSGRTRAEMKRSLIKEAQALAPDDPGHADGILRQSEAAPLGCVWSWATAVMLRHRCGARRAGAGQHGEGGADVVGAELGHDLLDAAARQHLAMMEDDDVVLRPDLVDEVGGPQHAAILLGDQAADMPDHVGPRRMSRPTVASSRRRSRGRCSKARAISTRRIWPPESERTLSRILPARSSRFSASSARRRASRLDNAVERRMIGQVLDHAQIEIEGAGLEHHAQPAQRLAGVALQLVAENADRTLADGIEAGDQREQGGFAGAIEAEQHREAAARHGEGDIVKGKPRPVGVADTLDIQGRFDLSQRLCRLTLLAVPTRDHSVSSHRSRHRFRPPGNGRPSRAPTAMGLVPDHGAT